MTAATLFDHLSKQHQATIAPLALVIWTQFITATVAALREAQLRLREPERLAAYSAKKGWWRTAKKKNAGGTIVQLPQEDAITHALTDILNEIRNEAREGNPLYDLNICFACQQPRRSQQRVGRSALTADIRAWAPDQRGLDLRLEAKLLFDDADIQREYCSARGVERFRDAENPYTDQIVGGMLGYFLTPDLDSWQTALSTALAETFEATIIALAQIEGETVPTLVSDIASSDGTVSVLHLLMMFDTAPTSH